MLITPFNPIHLKHINIQADQQATAHWHENDEYQALLMMGMAQTAISNGQIIACAGVFPLTDWMGRAWAIVGQDIGRDLLATSREIKNFLSNTDYARIDTPVRRDFINGHRWCRLLGFTNETPKTGMRCYGFEGETYDLYAFYPQEH